LSEKLAAAGHFAPKGRNTRAVVPIRLGDGERAQIARAAAVRELPLSGFIRQAALLQAAIVTEKVTPVKAPERERVRREVPVVVEEEAPERVPSHWVDGVPLYWNEPEA
jgi:hypothetical protein